MPIITEHTPENTIHTVAYDARLVDLEFESEMDRDQVDKFWSGIFFASLSAVERAVLSRSRIHTVELTPSDYDLNAQSVNVLLASHIETSDHSVLAGPVVWASVSTEGALRRSSGGVCEYSEDMRQYVRDLLAQTALNYTSIDDSLR